MIALSKRMIPALMLRPHKRLLRLERVGLMTLTTCIRSHVWEDHRWGIKRQRCNQNDAFFGIHMLCSAQLPPFLSIVT